MTSADVRQVQGGALGFRDGGAAAWRDWAKLTMLDAGSSMGENTLFMVVHNAQDGTGITSCCAACEIYLNKTCKYALDTGHSSQHIQCNKTWWGSNVSIWDGGQGDYTPPDPYSGGSQSYQSGCMRTFSPSATNGIVCQCANRAISEFSTMTLSTGARACGCDPGWERLTQSSLGAAQKIGACGPCAQGKYQWGLRADYGLQCSDCEAGKYGIAASASACQDCQAGKHSKATGATAVSTCVDCPSHSNTSQIGSTLSNCSCQPGYTGTNGGNCTACPVGTYTDTPGSAECIVCPSCSVALNRTAGCSSASTACECSPGYTGIGEDQCTACSAGKYKDVRGSAECLLCPTGKYTDRSRASVCLDCPADSDADAGSVDCTCNAGSFQNASYLDLMDLNASHLNMTEVREVSRITANMSSACLPCSRGTFSNRTGATVCEQCPWNQTSALASRSQSDCGCPLGYYNASGPCLDVNECMNTSNCPSAHMNCVNTPGSFHCACDRGYERVIEDEDEPQLTVEACTNINECERVEYQTCHELAYCVDTDGSFTCTCFLGITGNGTFCADTMDFCERPEKNDCHERAVCSYDTILAPGSFICTCNTGFSGDGVLCEDTDECLVGTTGSQGAEIQAACSPNALCNNTVGSFSCTCLIGYAGDGKECVGCAPGTYKAAAGNDMLCLPCSQNTYQNASAASSCRDCVNDTVSEAASDNQTDCVCRIAFTGPDGGTCGACEAGTYKSILGSSLCVNCSDFSDSPPQSGLQTDCICNTGELYRSLYTRHFVLPFSRRKSQQQQSRMILSSVSSSKPLTFCLSWSSLSPNVSGYHGPDGGTCDECEAGTYKDVTGSDRCTTCPDASSSPSASVNLTQCVCHQGYLLESSGAVTRTAEEDAAYHRTFIEPLDFTGLGVTQRKSGACQLIEDEKTVETVQQCRKTADIRFDALATYRNERSAYTWAGTKNIASEPFGCIVMQIRDLGTCGIDTIQTADECRWRSADLGYTYQEVVSVDYYPSGCLLTPSKNAFFNTVPTTIQCSGPAKLCLCSRPDVYFNDVVSSAQCTDARNCLCRDTRPLKCYPCAQGSNPEQSALSGCCLV